MVGALVNLALVGMAGCREEPREPGPESPTEVEHAIQDEVAFTSLSAAEIERLEALGYVSWGEAEDETLSGVTVHDRQRASAGYNLYTNDVNKAFLMNMDGEIVHTWHLPAHLDKCEYFELLPGGDIVAYAVNQGLVRVDWQSNVKWFVDRPFHHDIHVLPGGDMLVPFLGHRVTYNDFENVQFDSIARLTADGEFLADWSTLRTLEVLKQYHPPAFMDGDGTPPELKPNHRHYYHLNSVQALPETPLGERDERFAAGNLLICLRNVSLVFILDPSGKEVLWHYGPGELDYPHMPRMLDDGHILIFDNGLMRGHSRVIELDPVTSEIVWEYRAPEPSDFFSKFRGSSQRLANGNTLICESQIGRAFEVTREGEIVWEFWNPEIVDGKRKLIYRFTRRPEAELAPLLRP